jgi:hypothetical protein
MPANCSRFKRGSGKKTSAAEIQQNASVQKLELNEPLRIIISMRVEKEPETLA